MHDAEKSRARRLAEATEALGYKLQAPSKPEPLRETPVWMQDHKVSPETTAVQRIVDEEWPVAFIREQIRRLGVKPHGRSRLDLGTQLAETFLDSGRLEMVLGNLSKAARNYYAQVIFNLQIPYYFDADVSDFRLLQAPDAEAEVLFAEIVDAGLALEREGGFLIPNALITRLPPLYLEMSDAARAEPTNEPTQSDPTRLVQQIQQLFGLIRSGESRLRPSRYWKRKRASHTYNALPALPMPEDARRLNQMRRPQQMHITLMAPEPRLAPETLARWADIFDGDQESAEIIYHLLRALGVLRPGSPITLEPKHAENFLSLPPGRQIALLLDYYFAMNSYDLFWPQWRREVVQVRWDYRPYRGLYDYTFVLSRSLNWLRRTILELCGLLPPDVWLSFDALVTILSQIFEAGESQMPLGAIHFVDTQGDLAGFLDHYVQGILEKLLWRLGLSDLARADSGELEAFRLHGLQDLLWGRADALSMPTITWQGERDVRWVSEPAGLALSPPVPVAVLRQVQRWAEPKGVSEGALRYQLSLRRLHQVFEAGETPQTLTEAWEAGGETAPLPEVVDWWARWWERYGHVQLYPRQALLEVEDAFAMQELQVAAPVLREALSARLTPQAALLDREQTDALIRQLEHKGYMPKFITTEIADEGEH
jgi:hypothetical protein